MSHHDCPPRSKLILALLVLLAAPARTWAAEEHTAAGASAAGASVPAAGAPAARRELARQHYARGLESYARKDYAGALSELEQANVLAPSPKLLFAMGQAYAGLKRYAEAMSALQGYLDGLGTAVPPGRRDQVQRQLQAFRDLVARLHVSSSLEPTTIAIDGKEMGTSPLPRPVLLAPGVHRVTATHATSPPRTTWIELPAGSLTSLHFALPRQQPEPAQQLATPMWIATGVLAVLAIGSAAISFERQRDYERRRERPQSGDAAAAARALQSQRSEVSRWLLATDILAGVTLLSAGTAVYFSVAPLAGPELEPALGQGVGGVLAAAGGRF